MSDFIPQYKQRAPQDLEPDFTRHLTAMTAEGLHMKADIACELAWRDRRIAELEAERDSIRDEALEEAAKACEKEREVFTSTEYAVHQPHASFDERFACTQCVAAIRALKGTKP